MKKILSVKNLMLIFLINTVSAQLSAPIAHQSHIPEYHDYLFIGGYGSQANLVGEHGIRTGSLVVGEPIVSAPENQSYALLSPSYTGAFGHFSYLLNVPDAPLVTAGDAVSGEIIDVSWKIDINSPPADASKTHQLNSNEWQEEGQIAENTWLLRRNTISDSSETDLVVYPPQVWSGFLFSDGSQISQPAVNTPYNYGVLTSNYYGHSRVGEDVGFRISNARYSGTVRSPSHETPGNPENEASPGPPVQNAEVILTHGSTRPAGANYPIENEEDLLAYGNSQGKAVYLDGDDDYLMSESNFSDWFDGDNSPLGLDYDQDFTFEIWFKPAGNHLFKTVTNGGTELPEVLVDMGTEHGALKVTFNDGPAGDDFGLYIQYRGDYLYFDPLGTWGSSYDHFMTDEDGDGNPDTHLTEVSGWYHLAVVYNDNSPNADYLYAYVYEKSSQQQVAWNSINYNEYENYSESDMVFGRARDGSGHFNGYIDEIRFWTEARTAYEIESNRNRSLQITDSGQTGPDARVENLLAYWKMDDGYLHTAYDMADLDGDGGSKDIRQQLHLHEGAEFTTDANNHSEVRLSTYTEGTEGLFDIRNIPYDPNTGTTYTPTIYKSGHTEFQGTDYVHTTFDGANAHDENNYIWDHSTETIEGKVTYEDTEYGIKDVEIMIQYGSTESGSFLAGDLEWPDQDHPRYTGTLMRTEPRTFTDPNGNYRFHVEPDVTIRWYAYFGGHWEKTEPFFDSAEPIGGGYQGGIDANGEYWGDDFEDLDGDGYRDDCGSTPVDQEGNCYEHEDVIYTSAGTSTLFHEADNIGSSLTNKNFSNQKKDTVHIKIQGGLCEYSTGDWKIYVQDVSTFDGSGDYVSDPFIFTDNGEVYNRDSQEILVPPIPLYFKVEHCGDYNGSECTGANDGINQYTKSPTNPTGSNIIFQDLRDGPDGNQASDNKVQDNGDFIDTYDLTWLYRNPEIDVEIVRNPNYTTFDRDGFYTLALGSEHLNEWLAQVGPDGESPTEDDVPLPNDWGLSSAWNPAQQDFVEEGLNDYNELDEGYYNPSDYIYVKQGGYDPNNEEETVQLLRRDVHLFEQEVTLFTEFFVYSDYSDLNPNDEVSSPSKCGCDNFTININNNVADMSVTLNGIIDDGRGTGYAEGKVFHSFTTSRAKTSGDKMLNIYASAIDNSGPDGFPQRPPIGGPAAEYNQDNIIVIGANLPAEVEGQFDPEETNPIPFFILRDPPGDESFSFIEQGKTFCQEYSFSYETAEESSENLLAMLGVDIVTAVGTALGGFFSTDLEFDATADFEENWGTTNYQTTTETNVLCWEAQQTFSTSDIESHSPLLTDLYIGSGMVLNIGIGNRLENDLDNSDGKCDEASFGDEGRPCLYIKQELLTGAADFPAQFIYSEWSIVNQLLPEIYGTIMLYNPGAGNTDVEVLDHVLWWDDTRQNEIWFLYGPDGVDHKGMTLDSQLPAELQQVGYLIPPLRIPESQGDDANVGLFDEKVDLYNHWVSYVQRNQTLKAESQPPSPQAFMSYQSAAGLLSDQLGSSQSSQSQTDYLMGSTGGSVFPEGWVSNIFEGQSGTEVGLPGLTNWSFSGGTSYLYEFTNTAAFSNSIEFSVGTTSEIAQRFGLEVNGVGDVYGTMEINNTNATNSALISGEESRKIGIFFKDNDLDDLFQTYITVDAAGLPVYKVTSGRSSNPYEVQTGTARVHNAQLTVQGPTMLINQETNSTAVFRFQLENISETNPGTPDYYTFFLDPVSNLGGAEISGVPGIGGPSGIDINLDPDEEYTADIGVSIGPLQYEYNDLKFYLAAPFENEVAADWHVYNYATRELESVDPQNSDHKTVSVRFIQPCFNLGLDVQTHDEANAPSVEGAAIVVNHHFQEHYTGGVGFTINDAELLGEDDDFGSDDDFLTEFSLQSRTVNAEGGILDWITDPATTYHFKHNDPTTLEIDESVWNPNQEYSLGDVVESESGGTYYRCIEEHQSSEDINDDLVSWETVELDNQIDVLWAYPAEGDGEYFVRVISVCTNTQQAYSEAKRIIIDTQGPRIASAVPIDHVLGADDQIKYIFDEPILCIPGTPYSFLQDDADPSLSYFSDNNNIVPSTETCNENELIIHIGNSVLNWQIEHHTLNAWLGGTIVVGEEDAPGSDGDDIGYPMVTDLYGNLVVNEGGVIINSTMNPIEIDRNPIRWSVDNLEEVIYIGNDNSITVPIINNGSTSENFIFGENIYPGEQYEIPWWITPNPMQGTVNAGGSEDIVLTFDPSLPMGPHEGILYSESPDGDEPLHITANVLCPPPSAWAMDDDGNFANAADYEQTMTLVAYLYLTPDGAVASGHDLIAAYIQPLDGDLELRGVAHVGNYIDTNEEPPFDEPLTYLTVYGSNSDANSIIHLRLWHSDECDERWEYLISQSGGWINEIDFVSESVLGDNNSPLMLEFNSDAVARSLDLNLGYTLVSFNLQNTTNQDLNNYLRYFNFNQGDRIKTLAQGYAEFMGSETGWSGQFSQLWVQEAYMIHTPLHQNDHQYFTGTPINLEAHIMNLHSEWNWIGYWPNNERRLNTTVFNLHNEPPSTGDLVKDQYSFASFITAENLPGDAEEGMWLGNMHWLHPGRGYKVHLQEPSVLEYGEDDPGLMRSVPRPLVDIMRTYDELDFDPHLYQYTMNIIALVESDTFGLNDPNDQVLVYDAEGNIRGSGQPTYIAALDQHRLFLTLYANESNGEELTIRFHDSSEDIWYDCQDLLLFAEDGVTGSVLDPMMISLSPLSIGDRGYIPDTYVLSQNYPNPFNPVTSIGFGVPEPADVTVQVYNILGQEIRELFHGHMEPGYQFLKWDGRDKFGTPGPSGMYIVVMQSGTFIDSKKLILLK